MFLEFCADVASAFGPFEAAAGVPVLEGATAIDRKALGVLFPFLETADGEDVDYCVHVRDLCGGRVVRDDGVDEADDFVVRVALVDEVQVSAKGQVGDDIQCQETEGGVRIDGLVVVGAGFQPAVEVGEMVLHHFTHSKEVLLREDVHEILASHGGGVTGVAIGYAEHELVACQSAVSLVEVRLDLFGAVDEFDVLDIGGDDKVWGDSDDGT